MEAGGLVSFGPGLKLGNLNIPEAALSRLVVGASSSGIGRVCPAGCPSSLTSGIYDAPPRGAPVPSCVAFQDLVGSELLLLRFPSTTGSSCRFSCLNLPPPVLSALEREPSSSAPALPLTGLRRIVCPGVDVCPAESGRPSLLLGRGRVRIPCEGARRIRILGCCHESIAGLVTRGGEEEEFVTVEVMTGAAGPVVVVMVLGGAPPPVVVVVVVVEC